MQITNSASNSLTVYQFMWHWDEAKKKEEGGKSTWTSTLVDCQAIPHRSQCRKCLLDASRAERFHQREFNVTHNSFLALKKHERFIHMGHK